jgi:hypothetical protein
MGNGVSLRDEIETALRGWNRYEIARGAPPVVDFDCYPESAGEVVPAASRLAVRDRLVELKTAADADDGPRPLANRLGAALAYLDALLGVRMPITDYIHVTQGCAAHGWTEDYVASLRETAMAHLAGLGVSWGPRTVDELTAVEKPVDAADAADVIQKYASELESDVRQLTASDAPFDLTIEHVDLDVYWSYWLDGMGKKVRMRINARHASFTEVQARQFALHEILGHGLQCATYAKQCRTSDVPWVRITSVHAQQQVLLEGLAQALPLFVRPDDQPLVARVRLAHYLELVRAKLHLAVNNGASIPECVMLATEHVPFWRPAGIGDALSDRGADPLLRSYLWAYPAGIDWFVSLADNASADRGQAIVRATYRSPFTPDELADLWQAGPTIGGNAA